MNETKYALFAQRAEKGRARRLNNRLSSPHILVTAGLPFESKNSGAHLIVGEGDLIADFWPGTGLWKIRQTGQEGRGVFPLVSWFVAQRKEPPCEPSADAWSVSSSTSTSAGKGMASRKPLPLPK